MNTEIKRRRGFSGWERMAFGVAFLSVILVSTWVVFRAIEIGYQMYADQRLSVFANALEQFREEHDFTYPEDQAFGIPAELERYLPGNNWGEGPWPDSFYHWERYEVNGQEVIQLSIRFCPLEATDLNACRFPRLQWANDFGRDSAYFYCFAGPCRSHRDQPRHYPGFCSNCDCQEMRRCHSQ